MHTSRGSQKRWARPFSPRGRREVPRSDAGAAPFREMCDSLSLEVEREPIGVHDLHPIALMRVLPSFTFTARKRCRRLAERSLAMVLARRGARAHTHVFWFGLAGLAVLLAQAGQVGWFLLPSLVLFAALAVVVSFDVEFLLIPDGPLLVMFATGTAALLVSAPGELPARLAAACAAWGFLRLVAWAYQHWRGFAGLGFGDAKLFAIAGLWLGFAGLPGCLLVAAISGLASAAVLLRSGTGLDAREPMPFGPHLALGLWLAWSVGPLESGATP